MYRILFICHGNICRSPMAEFVMKDLVEQAGGTVAAADPDGRTENAAVSGADFVIASAATSREELGNPVYPPAKAKLEEHGLSCDGKRARRLTMADYTNYDLLICMDQYNVENTLRIIGEDPEGKVHMLLDYADRPGVSVADPWYTRDFESTWRDVVAGCRGLLQELY